MSELILSDAYCQNCQSRVGIQWFFRITFFLVTLIATVAVGLIVLVAEGLYAALLVISVPIGAIGFIKARFCPLVVRDPEPAAGNPSGRDV